MYCKNCGKELIGTERFCQNCGAMQNVQPPVPAFHYIPPFEAAAPGNKVALCIPEHSGLATFAGICMIVRLIFSMLLSYAATRRVLVMSYFPGYIVSVLFVVLVFSVAKKKISLFIVPLAATFLLGIYSNITIFIRNLDNFRALPAVIFALFMLALFCLTAANVIKSKIPFAVLCAVLAGYYLILCAGITASPILFIQLSSYAGAVLYYISWMLLTFGLRREQNTYNPLYPYI